eukprot:TRINITY_DN7790_c0_g1_i1.p2 TRINITY_DN7790_c0_g1~~TRINITY_DN7790_c0_g1_i1.p2  ORF type:complete len:131 (+),score=18.41 TRINITY_DN7790_c0_g1_i1:578-970(+)
MLNFESFIDMTCFLDIGCIFDNFGIFNKIHILNLVFIFDVVVGNWNVLVSMMVVSSNVMVDFRNIDGNVSSSMMMSSFNFFMDSKDGFMNGCFNFVVMIMMVDIMLMGMVVTMVDFSMMMMSRKFNFMMA